jgi:hypothetical protein
MIEKRIKLIINGNKEQKFNTENESREKQTDLYSICYGRMHTDTYSDLLFRAVQLFIYVQ